MLCNVKSFIKLFVPPLYYKIKDRLQKRSMNDFCSDIGKIEKSSDKLLVFGNGPSLKVSLQKYMSSFKSGDYDVLVVNNIVYDDCYEEIRPKYHMYMDPNLFIPLEEMSDFLRNDKEKFAKVFCEKVCWDVYFIVPSFAKGSWILDRVKNNSFIHPVFINTNDYSSYKSDVEKFKLWDSNLIKVPASSVLNTCVYYGVCKRYAEIYVLGADTNFLDTIEVDQRTNQVIFIHDHVYGKTKSVAYGDTECKVPIRLHEELISIANELREFWDLKAYSDYANCKIFNASEYSCIDAFERRKII